MLSTARSYSVTKSEPNHDPCQYSPSVEAYILSLPYCGRKIRELTVLFGARRINSRQARGYDSPCLNSEINQEVMDSLQIRGCVS